MSILAALHYYWLGGSAGGGTPGGDYNGLVFRRLSIPFEVTFTLLSDGTWESSAPSTGTATTDGNWFDPTTPGVGAGYEAKFTYSDTGNPGGEAINGAPDWTSLAAPISFSASLIGDGEAETWIVTCQIRDAGTEVVVTTGTFQIILAIPPP